MKHNQARGGRRKWLILLPFCVAGLLAVVLENPEKPSLPGQGNSVVDFVKDQYALLGKGRYRDLSRNVVEGLWKKDTSGYVLGGLMPKNEFEAQLEDDLGVGAWRLRFVRLAATGYTVVDRRSFGALLARESQILDVIDPSKSVQEVFVVKMAGHNTGRCSIIEWEKQVPVVRMQGRYLLLMRGLPDVYSLLHNEQWFLPTKF
jgi:hypothetical protein